MAKSQRLELTWKGKDVHPRLETRILLADPALSYCAETKRKGDIFDNTLIFGDNLLAFKSLEQHYTGKVKCVYIDPPYNTGNAFEHYDDGVEHSLWLGLMCDRISIIHRLLRPDGFFCCHIDDSEGPYLKVMLDEIFGRDNYLTTFFIQVRYPEKKLKQDMAFHKEIEQVHIYRKQYDNWIINPEYNAEMLSEAVCKRNGYTYDPNDTIYWQQGESVQGSYIYVTTQSLSVARLQELSEEVGII